MTSRKHYYEAHVTVEPVFDERLEEMRALANLCRFRVADLLMKKRKEDAPERSQCDTFCTYRSMPEESALDVISRTIDFASRLEANGFRVWRYKVESTLLDVRVGKESGSDE